MNTGSGTVEVTQMRRKVKALAVVVLLCTTAIAITGTAAATHNDESGDDSTGIVDSVTPDFLGDLMESLPVPDFVVELFGGDPDAN